ncbi:MAG: hypothetical protein ACNA7M_09575, partial [Roseovarius sp.]
ADGRDWERAYPAQAPVSVIEVTGDGTLHAFVLGVGLVRRAEATGAWESLHPGFPDRYLMSFAADPHAPERVFTMTQHGEMLASDNGGKSWRQLGIE